MQVAAELRDGTLKAAAKVVVTRMDGYQNAIPNKFEKLFPLGGVPALSVPPPPLLPSKM